MIGSDAAIAALGRFNVTHKLTDIGKYRTPSLRNVALTAPYMHDGSVSTLEEAVELEIYYRSSTQARPLIMTAQEKRDLVAFLKALTAESLEKKQGTQ
jgi:cytochrome c peroxidase